MKFAWCLAVVAAAAVTLLTAPTAADEEVMDRRFHRLGADQYVNAFEVEEEDEPVAPFNRGAVEHRPDSEDVRRAQYQFERNKPLTALSLINSDFVVDAERETSVAYVEQQDTYPESYRGFNGHSYQKEPPALDQSERPADPLPIDPSSVTRNGKSPLECLFRNKIPID